jgi:hypothetical protein
MVYRTGKSNVGNGRSKPSFCTCSCCSAGPQRNALAPLQWQRRQRRHCRHCRHCRHRAQRTGPLGRVSSRQETARLCRLAPRAIENGPGAPPNKHLRTAAHAAPTGPCGLPLRPPTRLVAQGFVQWSPHAPRTRRPPRTPRALAASRKCGGTEAACLCCLWNFWNEDEGRRGEARRDGGEMTVETSTREWIG